MKVILYQLSLYSVFLPLLAGLLNFRGLEAPAKLLFLIVACASVPHIATVAGNSDKLPVVFYNGYIIADAILWPLVFYSSISNKKIRSLIAGLFAFNLICLAAVMVLHGYGHHFHYELVCFNNIIQVIYIALFFYNLNNSNEYIELRRTPMFWFCMGLLFYAPCTFFVFLFYNWINSYYSKSNLNDLWMIHHFFNSLMYILFMVGLLLRNTKKHVWN